MVPRYFSKSQSLAIPKPHPYITEGFVARGLVVCSEDLLRKQMVIVYMIVTEKKIMKTRQGAPGDDFDR